MGLNCFDGSALQNSRTLLLRAPQLPTEACTDSLLCIFFRVQLFVLAGEIREANSRFQKAIQGAKKEEAPEMNITWARQLSREIAVPVQ
jgi:hypothetical protein